MTANNKGIPDGFQIHHICDNTSCCRPDHLRIGTNQENAIDMAQKGRQSFQRDPSRIMRGDTHPAKIRNGDYFLRGENHPMAQLTDAKVMDARERIARGEETQAQAARRLGVTTQTLWHAVSPNGNSFRHLPLPVYPPKQKKEKPVKPPREPKPARAPKPQIGSAHHNARFNDEQVMEMRALAAGGFSYSEIARQRNISSNLAWKLCSPKSTKWKHLENANTDTSSQVRKGESHPKAVLTAELVIEMRRLHYVEGQPIRQIAFKFGVSPSTTYQAVSRLGNAWRDLPFPTSP